MFISFSFEFFIRSDNFSGGVLMFNGAINLLAFNQVPRKIAAVTLFATTILYLTILIYMYSGCLQGPFT
jgi:hypothetical protein